MPVQISMKDMLEWQHARSDFFSTKPYVRQYLSLTINLYEGDIVFYFSPTFSFPVDNYEIYLTQDNAPNTYPLIKEMFSLTKDNAPPPFAFIDLFLEAMEADGDMSFHAYLEGKSQ